jgi:pyruvate/2-oxoglutarate dehydrogenase complex dihydrolipoamide dehydrogenase (E3) component
LLPLAPDDDHNRRLAEAVHPTNWRNPSPASKYNLVVIGAGTAGLVMAAGAAGLGAKVALVERELMGGDCLNFGCVPSKAIIRTSRTLAEICNAGRFGVYVPHGAQVDFGAAMERMRRLRADLSGNDSVARFAGLGVDVFSGDARFDGPDAVVVGEATLRFRRAAIATGARATAPPVPGLAEAGYLTNETVFSLTTLPGRIGVIGGGPIGCELAQALRRCGAEVSLLEAAPQILQREDGDAAARVAAALARDGVAMVTDCRILEVTRRGADKIVRFERGGGGAAELAVDEILVGAGRAPAVAGLNLEAAGVAYDEVAGVKVDDYLRTTNRRIYAAGDACGKFRFTHVADATARIVIRNALFYGRARMSALTIPWCTYTDPEVAHVGLNEAEAQARGMKVRTLVQEFNAVDRAILDDETDGLVKVHLAAGSDGSGRSDRIVGATIVARHAGEMISELTLAMGHGIGLGALADVIHPYPTQAEAIRKLGDQYNRTRLTPRVKWLFEHWLKWTR